MGLRLRLRLGLGIGLGLGLGIGLGIGLGLQRVGDAGGQQRGEVDALGGIGSGIGLGLGIGLGIGLRARDMDRVRAARSMPGCSRSVAHAPKT